jgi:spore maturation protein CgeB
LPRVYWALESLSRKLPIDYVITDPGRDDGMDQETSLYSYARLLAASHVGVNYVKRLDSSRILTGRTIEIVSLKRLLLQEACPAMAQYFIEGEHYLEFSDIESLCTAVEFIRAHPKTAQMIARDGHDYYLQHYSSKKLVEHFQVLLDS